jgi:hypothetical protein
MHIHTEREFWHLHHEKINSPQALMKLKLFRKNCQRLFAPPKGNYIFNGVYVRTHSNPKDQQKSISFRRTAVWSPARRDVAWTESY